ncbi:hypothetical protein T4D_5406 [Trichinella pseudospiralis]|uniref:Uncharacterized protein n=1 Tax=Trichinella pseudospiralis TaxID=6337 RepID=A0A0V1F6L8_TRIPS|nr:hypothetical protein T4D_12139 [Trichinella pseudospiralis]KRY81858.1 hypothetical protein T4D_5406 [Trichinella pseudospiralis]
MSRYYESRENVIVVTVDHVQNFCTVVFTCRNKAEQALSGAVVFYSDGWQVTCGAYFRQY